MPDRVITSRRRALLGAILLAIALPRLAAGQGRRIAFDRVDGLSQSNVNCIFQDRRGFMWFGTEDGLNRYDGYAFTVFKRDPHDPDSLSHNFVWAIREDPKGALWVGTEKGLNRLNEDGRFTRLTAGQTGGLSSDWIWAVHVDRTGAVWAGTKGGGLNRIDPANLAITVFRHEPARPESLAHDDVRSITEDSSGRLWLGLDGGGVDRLDPKSGAFAHYRHDPNDEATLSDDHVRSLFADPQGDVWIGTYEGGVSRLEPRTGHVTRFRHEPSDPGSLGPGRVRAIHQDTGGTLWVGSDGGLSELLPGARKFLRHRHDASDPLSLSDTTVSALYQDRGGVLWVGTRSGGLNRWNPASGAFVLFRPDVAGGPGLAHPVVAALHEDLDGGLWIGTYGGGLDRLDRVSGEYRHFRNDPKDARTISEDRVMSLLVGRGGDLWAGTLARGLNHLDRRTGAFQHYRADPENAASLSSDAVMSLYEDGSGALWVGTWNAGLNRLDRDKGEFTRYRNDPTQPGSLGGDSVTSMVDESVPPVARRNGSPAPTANGLWVGTRGGGLSLLDRSTSTFRTYRHDPADPRSLSSDQILSLHLAADGALWVGTGDAGLNRWEAADRLAGKAVFKRYTEQDGLPNPVIYGILGDDQGGIWLSTNNGLSHLAPRTGTFRNYDASHGLQGREFNFGAAHRGRRGEMFFGGTNGFNAFAPEKVRHNTHVPPVVLTSFTRFNEVVKLPRPLWETDSVEISYRDYMVSFEFAALDFTVPERNRYAYKLEGFGEDWIQLGTARRATYTNLSPGDYTLRVKASNNDGVWNEEGASLRIRVVPPPWRTWWAYGLYALLLVSLLYAWGRFQARKLEREAEYSRKLEREVQERTRELALRNQELLDVNQRLEDASLTDSLTGLRNRRFLMTEIYKDIAWVERHHRAAEEGRETPLPPLFLFLMVDFDGLKKVNDDYGHVAGDRALLQMTKLLQDTCRKSDTLIRWGGDEFLIVGREQDRSGGEVVSERIRHAVERHPFDVGQGPPIFLSCSIGFAFYSFLPSQPMAVTWEQVIAIADRALYIAKASGRNAWVGLLGVDGTAPADLVHRIDDDPAALVESGLLEVKTSIGSPASLVWSRS